MLRVFFFNDTATTEIYTLSLHDALPIWRLQAVPERFRGPEGEWVGVTGRLRVLVYNTNMVPESDLPASVLDLTDRKSTRLNSSHANISYAGFCLKKKN